MASEARSALFVLWVRLRLLQPAPAHDLLVGELGARVRQALSLEAEPADVEPVAMMSVMV